MTVQLLIVLGAALACALAAALALASLFRAAPSRDPMALTLVSIAGLLLVAVLAARGIASGRLPAFGQFESLAWYALAIMGVYIHMAIQHQTRGIAGIVIPFLTLLVIGAATGVNHPVQIKTPWPTGWLGLHVITAFVGYAGFTMASGLAVCYLIQDRNLKQKRLGALFERLPSLETSDTIMRQQIAFAFLMLTLSILFGIVVARKTGDLSSWLTDPKAAATAATWVVYAILLHLRMVGDRHGRKIALATIAGFFFVLFAFVGVHILSDGLHDFVLPATGAAQ